MSAAEPRLALRIIEDLRAVPAAAWDALVGAGGSPFLEWRFLQAFEESGCAAPDTGWQPLHLTLWEERMGDDGKPGERLVGSGPVAAGDTVRWMIGDTVSGSGASEQVHILVKPIRPDIATNLVINTDRRTYHLELRANPSVYMASVSWAYPEDELIALRRDRAEAERAAPVAAGMDLASLNFGYRIEGDKPAWRPLRAFDDGTRVFIEFPESVAQGELPPLFVLSTDLETFGHHHRFGEMALARAEGK